MTDIYQSPGDRLRFEILLKSLTEGSINLAVLSDHDMVLDYYGTLFEERLRAKGESHIEWCSSTNSERLVQKFNEILSEITLDQALEKDKKHAPRRFLVFRDSVLMQDFELQLLARLVNGFPAGNISIILLINSVGNYKSKIEAFGKNLLQWQVETEAGEPKNKLTDWVATEPELKSEPKFIEPAFLPEPPTLSDEVSPVSKLLNIPVKTAWRVPGFGKKPEPQLDAEPLPAFVPASAAAPAVPTPPVGLLVTPAASLSMSGTSREPTLSTPASVSLAAPASTDADVFKRPERKSRAGWVLLALLMSIGAFGVMYQDLVLQETDLLKKYLLRGTPAVAAPDEAASVAAVAASTEALAAAELAASMADEAARVASEAETVASAASAAAVAVAIVASEPAAAASAEASVKKASDKEPRSVNKADTKVDAKTDAKPEASSDDAWVNDLPANGYVVQLAAMDTQEEMRSFQRSNAAYAKTRILRTRHKDTGKRYFILVAGPFEAKPQADAFMQSSPLLAKGWLRNTKSIKTQFTKS
jgi:septal ring-binding cell division protein DamX